MSYGLWFARIMVSLWAVISVDSETRLLCGRVWNHPKGLTVMLPGCRGIPGTVFSGGFYIFRFRQRRRHACSLARRLRGSIREHYLSFRKTSPQPRCTWPGTPFRRGSYNRASMSGDEDRKRLRAIHRHCYHCANGVCFCSPRSRICL